MQSLFLGLLKKIFMEEKKKGKTRASLVTKDEKRFIVTCCIEVDSLSSFVSFCLDFIKVLLFSENKRMKRKYLLLFIFLGLIQNSFLQIVYM